jgi:hypothetical protein
MLLVSESRWEIEQKGVFVGVVRFIKPMEVKGNGECVNAEVAVVYMLLETNASC